jgi:hypothetical protein
MNNRLLFASAVFLAVCLAAPAAFATTPIVVEDVADESGRESRPFALTFVGKSFGKETVLVGLDLSIHLLDRLALGGQVAVTWPLVDASLYGRFVALARPKSALFVDLSLRTIAVMMLPSLHGYGAEIGYEWRSAGGFTFSISAGATLLRQDPCHHCGTEPKEHSRELVPMVTMRMGQAFSLPTLTPYRSPAKASVPPPARPRRRPSLLPW